VIERVSVLDACVATFRRYLHMPDPSAVYVALAVVAVNRGEGDPLWALVVGPPSSSKTEILSSVAGQPDVFPAATLTEAALLSGTPAREKAQTAKGGLLREIGEGPAILLLKDFGSVLSMNREARASVLAALREVYDGSWTRHLGVDGGRTLAWQGKVGLLGGVTPAVDSHHTVMGALGERFVLYRLPEIDADAQARRALDHVGRERQMRVDLARAAGEVLDTVDARMLSASPSDAISEGLVSLATLAVRARSAVERDSYSREVTLIPASEAPARFALVLLRLWNGLRAIGVDERGTHAIVAKAALDSMPQIRRQVLGVLVGGGVFSTAEVAEAIGYPSSTTRRACEDLVGHGVVVRAAGGQGKADLWSASDFTLQRWPTVPEMSEAPISSCTHTNDNSGKVPRGDAPERTDQDLESLFAEDA